MFVSIESTEADKHYGSELAISREPGAPPAEPLVVFNDDDTDMVILMKHLIQNMVEFSSDLRPDAEKVMRVLDLR